MEYADKLIPLIILLGVGAFLTFLFRRAPERPAEPPREAEPVPLALPVEVPLAMPVVVSEPKVETPAPVVAPAKPIVAAPKKPATPVHAVLELLQSKDALAKAFLLREILDKPVSRRR